MNGPIKVVPKEWGVEHWVVNETEYCWKVLDIFPNKQCSLHYHPVKKETFVVQAGDVLLQRRLPSGNVIEVLHAGDQRTIDPGTPHRFAAGNEGARICEISTHHDDADVERLEPSGDLTKDWK